MRKLDELDRVLGKGQTLSPKEIKLVLAHGVPAWLIVGSKVGGPVAGQCARQVEALAALYDSVQLSLPEVLRTKVTDG